MTAIDFTIERLILKAGNALNNIRISDLEKSRLTPAQSETILFYVDNGGKSIKDLAIHLKISHQAARKLVDKLKDKTTLESVISKKDRQTFNEYFFDELWARDLYHLKITWYHGR